MIYTHCSVSFMTRTGEHEDLAGSCMILLDTISQKIILLFLPHTHHASSLICLMWTHEVNVCYLSVMPIFFK